MLQRNPPTSSVDPTRPHATTPDGAGLEERAAELERQAEEQLDLLGITANGYMQRLHSQLAESLRLEAAMLREQRESDKVTPAWFPRWSRPRSLSADRDSEDR